MDHMRKEESNWFSRNRNSAHTNPKVVRLSVADIMRGVFLTARIKLAKERRESANKFTYLTSTLKIVASKGVNNRMTNAMRMISKRCLRRLSILVVKEANSSRIV